MRWLGLKSYALGLSVAGMIGVSLIFLLKAGEPPKEEKSARAYAHILRLMGRRQYDAAIIQCRQLMADAPADPRAYRKLVEAYREKHALDTALYYFQDLLRQNPQNSCAYYGLGIVYREKRDYPKALESLQRSIRFAPSFSGVFTELVRTYADLRKSEEAVSYLRRLIECEPNYAYAYYAAGYAHRMLSAWDNGLVNLDQALQLNPHLIEAVLMKAEIQYLSGHYMDAAALYAAGLKQAEQKNDWELKGRMLLGIGVAQMSLGHYPIALDYLYKAQRMYQTMGDPAQDGAIQFNIGFIHYHRSEYEQALTHLQSAVASYRAIGNRRGEAGSLKIINSIYRQQHGNYQKALEHYKEILRIYRDVSYPLGQAEVLNSMGIIYHENLGDATNALAYYHQAADIFQELGHKPKWAESLINIANADRDLGDHQKSIQYLQRALEILQQSGDRKSEADTAGNLANIYEDLGDDQKAFDYRASALVIFRKIGDREGEARILNDLGTAYGKLGAYAKALDFYQQALVLNQKINYRVGEGVTLTRMGDTYARTGEYEKAILSQRQARKLAEAISHPEIAWMADAGLARVFEKQGNVAQAMDRYKSAIAGIEKIRGQLLTGDQKAGYMQNKLESYENLIRSLLRAHATDPLKGYDREAFVYAERLHARALLETLVEAKVNVQSGISASRKTQERELSNQISHLQNELFRHEGVTPEQREALLSQLNKLDRRWEEFLLELQRSHAHYAQLRYPQSYALPTLQQQVLDPDEVLLEYMIGEQQSYVFVVTQNQFETVPLPGRAEIESNVKRYLGLITNNPQKLGPHMEQAFRDTYRQGYKLYRMLFAGVKTRLPSKWIIVADGILHYMPFEALVEEWQDHSAPANKERREPVRYVAEDYTIAYAPSASVLGEMRRAERPQPAGRLKNLLVLGDPAFPGASFMGQTVRPLPHSRAEAERIGRLFSADTKKICLGDQAKESVVKNEAGEFRFIHFATHGWIDDHAPLRSALLLAGDSANDGLMQMHEIFNLDLNADLVVLSACQTGLGKDVRGEGLMSMTRAFLYAGAQSVVVTLWNVHDETTADLMERFYLQLREAQSKGDALRQAKRSWLSSERPLWRHPYFWAGFILAGNNK